MLLWVFTKTLKPVAVMVRELGIRLVIYIDDILIMAVSKDNARDDTRESGVCNSPSGNSDCFNSGHRVLGDAGRLAHIGTASTREKAEAAHARSNQHREPPSAREVSRLLGKMNSVSHAIAPAPLLCRAIQMDLAAAVNEGSQSYEAPCPLSLRAREELAWWSG